MNIITPFTKATHNPRPETNNWIAFDLEWEPEVEQQQNSFHTERSYNTNFTSAPPLQDYHKISIFGYEDAYGN